MNTNFKEFTTIADLRIALLNNNFYSDDKMNFLIHNLNMLGNNKFASFTSNNNNSIYIELSNKDEEIDIKWVYTIIAESLHQVFLKFKYELNTLCPDNDLCSKVIMGDQNILFLLFQTKVLNDTIIINF